MIDLVFVLGFCIVGILLVIVICGQERELEELRRDLDGLKN